MNAKEFFAHILSSENMQAVVNCESLPVVEIEEDECREAYKNLSALKRCVLKHRVSRYVEAFASRRTSQAREQYLMLYRLKEILI
ncbi:MAG: hypothetical protein IJ545_07940 [Alphaproteobacteria bacterium]|nr:hypothetical protein [Alphaproteobacteria bacterium]